MSEPSSGGGYDLSSKTSASGGNDSITAGSFSTSFGGSDIGDQAFWLANSSNPSASAFATIPTAMYVVAGIVALAVLVLAVRK
jgi:hypothetical protein